MLIMQSDLLQSAKEEAGRLKVHAREVWGLDRKDTGET